MTFQQATDSTHKVDLETETSNLTKDVDMTISKKAEIGAEEGRRGEGAKLSSQAKRTPAPNIPTDSPNQDWDIKKRILDNPKESKKRKRTDEKVEGGGPKSLTKKKKVIIVSPGIDKIQRQLMGNGGGSENETEERIVRERQKGVAGRMAEKVKICSGNGNSNKKTERKPSNPMMLRKNFETELIKKPDYNMKQKSNIAKQILLFETQADRGKCALGKDIDKVGQKPKKQSGSSASQNSRGIYKNAAKADI